MALEIKRAERSQKKAKIALIGVSGGGKTYTALMLAKGLKGKDDKILLLDSERGSATLYSDLVEFDHANLTDTRAETYISAMIEAHRLGYTILIVDSVSHAWESLLEAHEAEVTRAMASGKRRADRFTAWRAITPLYNKLINAIVKYPGHCIITMRAKSEYVIEEVDGGKHKPTKVGLAAIMRPGSEYEFDVVGLIDLEHNLVIEKTRFSFLADQVFPKAGEDLGVTIRQWLLSGKEEPAKMEKAPAVKKVEAPAREFFYDILPLLNDDPTVEEEVIKYLVKNGAVALDGDRLIWRSGKALPKLAGKEIANPDNSKGGEKK